MSNLIWIYTVCQDLYKVSSVEMVNSSSLWALVCDVYCDFVTFPFGILVQVWYLIVSIPDPCCLSYFYISCSLYFYTFVVWSADIDKQWVDEVLLSSPQFDNDKIVGEPDVYPEYSHVDSHNWIPANIFPYIQLEFKHRRFIKHLDIYETFNAGCVIKIMGRDPDGSWQTLWNATSVEVIERSRIFSPTLNFLDFPIKVISIQTNCSMLENCEEIDAVQMTGCKHRRG